MKRVMKWQSVFLGVALALLVGEGCARQSSLTVTFPGSALQILPEWERIEQMRDWVVYAFLVARGIQPELIALALHNQPPLRQSALSEVHLWQHGVGRWAWIPALDAVGDLYCFLPEGADDRLVGGLADDFRRLTGQIPDTVYYVAYAIDEQALTAKFSLQATLKGAELFKAGGRFGYRERTIRGRKDLEQFLKEIDVLVHVKVDKGVLVLGGRDIPGWGLAVDVEDIATLYQAYLGADDVGFSLDPKPFAGLGREERDACIWMCLIYGIAEIVPCSLVYLYAALPAEVPGVPTERWEEIRDAVFWRYLLPLHQLMKELLERGTDEARQAYEKLKSLLHKYVPQCARYDGGLQGTKVGMTLFYCDLLAKLWLWDFQRATPREIGMVPGLELPVAPVHWPTIWELPAGRLWFAQDYSKISRSGNSFFFSPLGTRFFSAADDPERPGEEVAPSRLPERMRVSAQWWNARWPQIMEKEPEYFRLNELQKWSAVIAWLKHSQQMKTLSFIKDEPVLRTLEFPAWLEANRPRLAFKGWLPFTGKSDAGTECLSIICSETRPAFGSPAAFLRGGVSLSDPEAMARVPNLEEEFLALVRKILRTGEGSIRYLNSALTHARASYKFIKPGVNSASPGPDASFRGLYLQFPGVTKTECVWKSSEPNNYEYSSDFALATGQLLKEKLTLTRVGYKVTIEFNGSGSLQLAEYLAIPRETTADPASGLVDAILRGEEPWPVTETAEVWPKLRGHLSYLFAATPYSFKGTKVLLYHDHGKWPVLKQGIPVEYVVTLAAHIELVPFVPSLRDLDLLGEELRWAVAPGCSVSFPETDEEAAAALAGGLSSAKRKEDPASRSSRTSERLSRVEPHP